MGILSWILKAGSDELAAESKQGKGGISNWMLRQSLDGLASRLEKDEDESELRSESWIYRFNSYEDAISYLDDIEVKYQVKHDSQMNDYLGNAYAYAKDYFNKNTE